MSKAIWEFPVNFFLLKPGVTTVVIWKEAIHRTLAQTPHIRHRVAEKLGRESVKQQQGEGLSRMVPSINSSPDDQGPQGSSLPGREKKRGGRHRRDSIKKLAKDFQEKASSSGRRRRSIADSERRRRSSQQAEERSKDFPSQADSEAEPQVPVARETLDEPHGPAQPEAKGSKKLFKQNVADEQKSARRHSSKGILSRAGSLFRRATTEISKETIE